MKKIVFYVTAAEETKATEYFLKQFKNSRLSFNNDKFYFTSASEGDCSERKSSEVIQVDYSLIEFDEKLSNALQTVLEESYEVAKTISEEKMGKLEQSVHSEIITTVDKYGHEECKSVFYLVSELFYKLLMGHHLTNGNKRLSFMFLISCLRFFGYHLPWTYGEKKDYKHYESRIVKWVEKFQKNGTNNSDQTNKISYNVKEIMK